jgi:outer membrane protein TolC
MWFWLFFLGWVSVAQGQSLTLRKLMLSVDEHYPLIAIAEADFKKALADQRSAAGGFDPLLQVRQSNALEGYYRNRVFDVSLEQPTSLWGTKVFTGWKRASGNFSVYDAQSMTFTGGEFRVGLQVPLLKGGMTDERRTRLKTAEQSVHVAQEAYCVQKKEVQKQAKYRYWEWVAAGQKVFVAKELLKIAIARNQAIEKRIQRGDLPGIDLMDNERSIFQRQSGLTATERLFQKISFELSLYYRNHQGNPLVPSLEDLGEHQVVECLMDKVHESDNPSEFQIILKEVNQKKGYQHHPEMKRLQWQSLKTQAELRLAKNHLLPKLDAKFGFYSESGSNPSASTSPSYSYLPPSYYPSQMKFSLLLEFPLFFRTASAQVQAHQVLLDKVDILQKFTQDKLALQLKDAISGMTTAYEKFKFAQQEVRISIKLENSEKLRAFHGDSNFMLVNLREQSTRDAIGKGLDAYTEFYKAKADYDYVADVVDDAMY